MAITWEFNITNVDIDKGRGDVRATRTDTESALAPRSYSMQKTPMATGPQKAKIISTIQEWDEAFVSNETVINTYLDGLEASAAATMAAWELTR